MTALVMAVVLVVAGAAVPATVMAQSNETATETPTPDGANESANDSANESAGALLQGVIGVQEAEIDGEIRSESFGIRTAQAASDDAKADVVAEELEDIEQRLDELEERKQRLEQEREAGNISRGQYRAEMAKLAVETKTAESLANESADTAEELPAEVLEQKGINATAIRTLSERADELTGPEVSRIARDIAGRSLATERAGNATEAGGAPDDVTDGTNRTATDGDDRTNRTATDDGENRTDGGADDGTQTATPDDTEPDGSSDLDARRLETA